MDINKSNTAVLVTGVNTVSATTIRGLQESVSLSLILGPRNTALG